jgi:hypothetical protein
MRLGSECADAQTGCMSAWNQGTWTVFAWLIVTGVLSVRPDFLNECSAKSIMAMAYHAALLCWSLVDACRSSSP